MAVQTYSQQLEAVQAAIEKVLTGQSYSIGGRTLTRADLDSLTKREQYLRAMVDRENGGGIKLRRGVFANG
jgi:hypothetical protein